MNKIKKLLVVMNRVTSYYRHNHSCDGMPDKAMVDMCNVQIDAEKAYKNVEPATKLFEIMKDNINYNGKFCSDGYSVKPCFYIAYGLCTLFYDIKLRDVEEQCERCQQCIDIFGGWNERNKKI